MSPFSILFLDYYHNTKHISLEGIIIGNNSRLDKQARKVLFKVSSFLEKYKKRPTIKSLFDIKKLPPT